MLHEIPYLPGTCAGRRHCRPSAMRSRCNKTRCATRRPRSSSEDGRVATAMVATARIAAAAQIDPSLRRDLTTLRSLDCRTFARGRAGRVHGQSSSPSRDQPLDVDSAVSTPTRLCTPKSSAGLMSTEARGNYLPEVPYLRETKTYLNCI